MAPSAPWFLTGFEPCGAQGLWNKALPCCPCLHAVVGVQIFPAWRGPGSVAETQKVHLQISDKLLKFLLSSMILGSKRERFPKTSRRTWLSVKLNSCRLFPAVDSALSAVYPKSFADSEYLSYLQCSSYPVYWYLCVAAEAMFWVIPKS